MTARLERVAPARSAAAVWWRHFWDGMSPFEVIRHELRLTPPQRMAALRAFTGLMLVSLLSVALRPPPFTALSFSIVLTFASKSFDANSAVAAVVRLLLEVAAATLLSVLTLALWADQPWFLLPWAVGIITLLLFYTRTTGGFSFPAVFFVVSVFYFPLKAVQDANLALGTNLIALMAGGAIVLTHALLWPRRPQKTLHRLLQERIDRVARVLDRLSQHGQDGSPPLLELPVPGVLTDQLQLLQSAERVAPALHARHQEYLDLIVELDAWFNLATWVQRRRHENPDQWTLDAADRARFRLLAERCRILRRLWVAAAPDALRRAALDAIPPLARPGHLGFAMRQLEQAAERTQAAVLALRRPPSSAIPPAIPEPRGPLLPTAWQSAAFWRQNTVPLHFGMKYAFGVVVCLLLIQAFHWPGIDTAMMTCLVVAQSSLGADYRKSMLRFLGASTGGLLALFFIVVLQPALVTVAGFLLAIAPVCGLAAWVGSASPRISYMGLQIGYSFASVVLHGVGPVTDLALARDRVLGILLGITVMGLLDSLLWPHRADRQIRAPLLRALRALGGFAALGTHADAVGGLKLMHEIDKDVRQTLELLDQARLEPGADQAAAEAARARAGLLVGDVHRIARTLQTRLRHRLGSLEHTVSEEILRVQESVDQALARTLLALADEVPTADSDLAPGPRESLTKLERLVHERTHSGDLSPLAAQAVGTSLYFDSLLCEAVDDLIAHADGLPV